MRLSVIIACLNGADTIGVQLEALANQQWSEPWEVIFADNGSTDGTVTIVEQYKHKLPNLLIVDASDRPGKAHASNLAMLAASGEAFAFCDADDEVAPGWIAAMGEALAQYDFVGGAMDYLKLNEAKRVKHQVGGIKQAEHPPFLPFCGGCNFGFNRSVYQALGGFDESFLFNEDTEYCWRAQLAGTKLQFVPNAIVHYRHRNSLAASYRQARNWSESYVILRKKYGGSLSRLMMLKLLIGGWRHMPLGLLQIRSWEDLVEFAWQFGWKIGEMRGCIKQLTLPGLKPLGFLHHWDSRAAPLSKL